MTSQVQDARWCIAETSAWTASGNDIVAIDLRSLGAHPRTLQGTAAFIWEELAESGPVSATALIASAADAYEVSADVVRDDVLSLLQDLQDFHLIRNQTTPADI